MTNPDAIHCYHEAHPMGYAGYIGSRKIYSKLLDVSIPDSCYKIDDDFIETTFRLYKIPFIMVKYNNDESWTCSQDQKKTSEHPKWRELILEGRPWSMIKKCISDCTRLNKI